MVKCRAGAVHPYADRPRVAAGFGGPHANAGTVGGTQQLLRFRNAPGLTSGLRQRNFTVAAG